MEVKKYMCDGEIEYKNTGNPRCKVPKLKKWKNTSAQTLFDFLRLELDSLSVDEDTLALVRLWPSPLPNLRGKLGHLALVDALQKNASGLRCAGLNAFGNTELNGVGEADLQRNKLLSGVSRGNGCGLGFNGGSVTDTNKTQDANVAFGDAGNVVLEKGASGTYNWRLLDSTFWPIDTPSKQHIPHIARWCGTSLSWIDRVAFEVAWSWLTVKKEGMLRVISPGIALVLRFEFCDCQSITYPSDPWSAQRE